MKITVGKVHLYENHCLKCTSFIITVCKMYEEKVFIVSTQVKSQKNVTVDPPQVKRSGGDCMR